MYPASSNCLHYFILFYFDMATLRNNQCQNQVIKQTNSSENVVCCQGTKSVPVVCEFDRLTTCVLLTMYLAEWHKLAYLVLTYLKTPINLSINQSRSVTVSQSVNQPINQLDPLAD